eukprot:Awhi_evm2s12113
MRLKKVLQSFQVLDIKSAGETESPEVILAQKTKKIVIAALIDTFHLSCCHSGNYKLDAKLDNQVLVMADSITLLPTLGQLMHPERISPSSIQQEQRRQQQQKLQIKTTNDKEQQTTTNNEQQIQT